MYTLVLYGLPIFLAGFVLGIYITLRLLNARFNKDVIDEYQRTQGDD